MKLLAFTLLALCVLGAVVADPQPAATATTATTPMTHEPRMETDMEADPIYQEYIKKARELYVKALTDYYHAHPDRLESDLSGLTSMEYESMVPPELLDAFNIDKAKIEEKIKENDNNEMDEEAAEPEEADHDEDMQAMAVEDTADQATDMETQQFGRFGRFGGFGRFGRFGGWGFGRRFGWGGYGGWGWGYPGWGYGGSWGGGYGFPWWGRRWGWGGWGGYGRFGFGRRGFI